MTRFFTIAIALSLFTMAGCSRSGSEDGSSKGKSPSRMSPPELSTHVATAGATGAINAVIPPQQYEPKTKSQQVNVTIARLQPPSAKQVMVLAPHPPETPAPPSAIEVTQPVKMETRVIHRTNTGIRLERIESMPKETKTAAEEDALRKARFELVKRLGKESPPIATIPSLARMKEYMPANSLRIREADPAARDELKTKTGKSDWYVAEMELEVSDDQIRDLRQEERVQHGLITALVLAGLGGFGYGIIRLGSAVWQKRLFGVPVFTMAIAALAPLLFAILYRIR